MRPNDLPWGYVEEVAQPEKGIREGRNQSPVCLQLKKRLVPYI